MQEVVQNNSPPKSHILTLFLAPPLVASHAQQAFPLPHPVCQGMAATEHMEVSSLGVVCDWNGVDLQVVAAPLPVLARMQVSWAAWEVEWEFLSLRQPAFFLFLYSLSLLLCL